MWKKASEARLAPERYTPVPPPAPVLKNVDSEFAAWAQDLVCQECYGKGQDDLCEECYLRCSREIQKELRNSVPAAAPATVTTLSIVAVSLVASVALSAVPAPSVPSTASAASTESVVIAPPTGCMLCFPPGVPCEGVQYHY